MSAAHIRQHIRDLVAGYDGPVERQAVDDALLAASELATNAVTHGGGISGYAARIADELLVLAVADEADELPVAAPRPLGSPGQGGFGWPIIQRLARHVAVEPGPRGKTITVFLPLR